MNCANHPDIAAVAFCRTCGKPLCAKCVRDVRGMIYCEPCLATRLEAAPPTPAFVPPAQNVYPPGAPAAYTPAPNVYPPSGSAQPAYPPVGAPVQPVRTVSGPNPAVAGLLSLFPGVGAVYSGQYAKGIAHFAIFAALCAVSSSASGAISTLAGFMAAFFYFYQMIDAVRAAKALQEGQPAPDPMGFGQTFSMGDKFDTGKVPTGAVLLIVLGILFLLHTMGFEYGFDRFWPLIIVFLGVWMFYKQWERSHRTCQCGRCSTRWLMGPAMVLTTGVLLLLQTTGVADLNHTWPAWILVIGIVKLIQSSASSAGHVSPLPPAPPPAAPPPPPASSTPGPTSPSEEVRDV